MFGTVKLRHTIPGIPVPNSDAQTSCLALNIGSVVNRVVGVSCSDLYYIIRSGCLDVHRLLTVNHLVRVSVSLSLRLLRVRDMVKLKFMDDPFRLAAF